MRVLYDHQIFGLQDFGGISRFFVELLRNRVGFEADLALVQSGNVYLSSGEPWCKGVRQKKLLEKILEGAEFRGKGRILDILRALKVLREPKEENLRNSLKAIADGGFDVLHPTYYDPYFLDAIGDKPFVLTVFDMIHEILPEFFPSHDRTSEYKKFLCERAARVMAISNTTKMDLVRELGITEAKVNVVCLASSLGDFPNDRSGVFLPFKRYVLFSGNRFGYKNFHLFHQVMVGIMKREPDIGLVCAGPPFSSDEIDILESSGIADRVFQTFVEDRHLANLYRMAELFVFPSLYEGFGLPLLEAFSCGCPVAASDIPVFREVAGDAACFFKPDDPSSMREVIEMLIKNQKLRFEMVERGYRKNKEFGWDKTVTQALETYEMACS
jgi:glycosyltransferase involved in cell wall biosynthesis